MSISRSQFQRNVLPSIAGLLAMLCSVSLIAQDYPMTALQSHQQAHGNMEAVAELELAVILERAILTLDLIETNPENRLAHLSAFQSHLLPVLAAADENAEGYNATLVGSLQFRYAHLTQATPVPYLLPIEGTGGRSSSSSFQNATVAQVGDCLQFDFGFQQYCSDSEFQTFILTEAQGGSSSHYENIELYLRTMDWSRHGNQDELNQALVNAGIEPGVISQFANDFDPNNNVQLLQKFQQDLPRISDNPNFYMLQNIGEQQFLRQIQMPAGNQ